MKYFFFIFLSFFIHNLFGQIGGESSYQFLNLSTSARQIALGGEVLNIIEDVNQPIWNPSTINLELDNKFAVNYSSYLAGISIGSITYAKIISRRFGAIHGNISYLNYGSLVGSDDSGIETGNFNANDISVSFGYALVLPNSNFRIGSNFKIINSNIGNYSSFGIALDIGLLYFNEFRPYSFTIVARNIGTQLKSFNGTNENLPFKIAFGGSYRLEYVPLKLYLTLDNLQKWNISASNPSNGIIDLDGNFTEESIGFLNNMLRHFVIGAELFPESAINLRIGYNFKRAQELALQNARTFSGISFGFGIKMNKFNFNYAYSKFHSAANASTFSLLIDLDKR